jgi:hypothetical protein
MVRFLLPKTDSSNFYDDRNLLITARCALLASEWKQTDQQYSKLHGKFEAALKAELKNRFDRYALLTTWDFQAPKNCTFAEEAHGAMGADIPAAVEKHVAANHFAPEDFEAFMIQAAGRSDTIGQILALLREPPLPGKTAIPYLGDVNIYDQVLRVVAKDKIALNAVGRWWHKEPGESTGDALVRLRQRAWYSGQAMFAVQVGETSQVGSGGVVVTPPIPTPPSPVPPGPIVQPQPLPPTPPFGGGPMQPLPITMSILVTIIIRAHQLRRATQGPSQTTSSSSGKRKNLGEASAHGDTVSCLAWISEGANESWCSPTGARPVRVRP